jgi:hypothetical protein
MALKVTAHRAIAEKADDTQPTGNNSMVVMNAPFQP